MATSTRPKGTMKTLTIANQKGGVGKTTLTAHLAYAAQAANKRVLLIDADPQGSLSLAFNTAVADPACLTTTDLFPHPPSDKPLSWVDDHLALVPADDALFDLVSANVDQLMLLRASIQAQAPQFDLCLIDTPPERNSLLIAAMAAADFVITPMTLGLYEQHGVRRLFDSIEATRSMLNSNLRHLGILLMKTNPRSPREVKLVNEMRANFGDHVLPGQLPERAAVRYSVNNRTPVWENPRGSTHEKAAKEWRDVCTDILSEIDR